MSEPYRKVVVAGEDRDGTVVYQFGWARDVEVNMNRENIPQSRWEQMYDPMDSDPGRRRWDTPQWTTVVEWASPPRQTYRYPSADDFSAALPEGQRALPC